jgi:hypothetical protein
MRADDIRAFLEHLEAARPLLGAVYADWPGHPAIVEFHGICTDAKAALRNAEQADLAAWCQATATPEEVPA